MVLPNWKLGVRSVTLGEMPSVDKIRWAADHGLDALELSFNRCPELSCADAGLAETCRTAADRHGIDLTAHAQEDTWLSDPDPAGAAQATAVLAQRIEQIARFGAQSVVVHACPYRPRVPGRESAQAVSLARSIVSLATPCAAYGVALLIETLTRQSNGYTSTLDHIIAAVDHVDSPWIGICVDTNHINTCEPLNPAIRRAGSRVKECHCNDNHGETEEHLLPFDGTIDWHAFGRALLDIHFDGALILEPSHFDFAQYPDLLTAVADRAARLRRSLPAIPGEAGH